MMKKKTAAILAAVLLMFILLSGFTEPSPPLWGYSCIMQAENFGLLKDYSAGNFGPGDVAEKEHLAQMIYTALEKGEKLKSAEDFSGEYAASLDKYKISPAAKKSVAYGWKYGLWSESDFAGTTAITREMAAKWLVNASEVPVRILGVLDFKDAAAAGTAYYRYADTALKNGLMQVGPDGGFHPELTMVRMEAAALSVGLYNFKAPAGGTKNADISVIYGKSSDFDSGTETFRLQTEAGLRGIQISSKAKLIVNGKPGSFDSVKALSGQFFTVAFVNSENQTVLVQTKPVVLQGTVVSAVKKTDYTLLTVNLDGAEVPFCITDNTAGTKSFAAGDSIRFIPDGCEIIEAAK